MRQLETQNPIENHETEVTTWQQIGAITAAAGVVAFLSVAFAQRISQIMKTKDTRRRFERMARHFPIESLVMIRRSTGRLSPAYVVAHKRPHELIVAFKEGGQTKSRKIPYEDIKHIVMACKKQSQLEPQPNSPDPIPTEESFVFERKPGVFHEFIAQSISPSKKWALVQCQENPYKFYWIDTEDFNTELQEIMQAGQDQTYQELITVECKNPTRSMPIGVKKNPFGKYEISFYGITAQDSPTGSNKVLLSGNKLIAKGFFEEAIKLFKSGKKAKEVIDILTIASLSPTITSLREIHESFHDYDPNKIHKTTEEINNAIEQEEIATRPDIENNAAQ